MLSDGKKGELDQVCIISLVSLALVLAAVGGLTLVNLYSQGTATPAGNSEYVALGSSFAAGPGVTTRAFNSPNLCIRSNDNYAHILARMRGLNLTDVTCSGATTKEVLVGGQYFQPAQMNAVNNNTKLVTVTIGGNDVFYLGSLLAWSCANDPSAMPVFWRLGGACKANSSAQVEQAFSHLEQNRKEIAAEVHRRALQARLVFVDYTTVLPDSGACKQIPLTEAQMQTGREVAKRLSAITQKVAQETHSDFVLASRLTHGHDVCSAEPWVFSFQFTSNPLVYGPLAYHPKEQAMQAIARALDKLLDTPQK
jgi:lysophospholipase L1-like esterase